VYTHSYGFDLLQAEWDPLLQSAPIKHIFYTWEWQKTWWQAYEPGALRLIALRQGGALVALAPLFIEDDGAQRVLRIVGCVDVTDYLDIIADEALLPAALAQLADLLVQRRAEYDRIDFCNIPAASPTCKLLPPLLAERGFSPQLRQQEVCPIIELPNDWSGYLAQLDKKQRHEVRRKLRRAHAQGQAVDWYIVDDSHDLSRQVEQFLRLMARSDPEKAQFLQDKNHARFFRAIVPLLQARGWNQLNFLTMAGQPAAAYINFVYGDTVFVYNSGLDMETYARLSPGIVLLAYNIRHAIEQGYRRYDFLRGDEAYKYRMGAKDSAVMNIRAQ